MVTVLLQGPKFVMFNFSITQVSPKGDDRLFPMLLMVSLLLLLLLLFWLLYLLSLLSLSWLLLLWINLTLLLRLLLLFSTSGSVLMIILWVNVMHSKTNTNKTKNLFFCKKKKKIRNIGLAWFLAYLIYQRKFSHKPHSLYRSKSEWSFQITKPFFYI